MFKLPGPNAREGKDYACSMRAWAGWKDTISLDRLCRALKVQTPKGDLDGSKVFDAWLAGELDRIATYNRADVIATRECWRRINWEVRSMIRELIIRSCPRYGFLPIVREFNRRPARPGRRSTAASSRPRRSSRHCRAPIMEWRRHDNLICGIDPGLGGGVAFLTESGAFRAVYDMPIVTATTGRNQIDGLGLAAILRRHVPTITTVERVGPRPGEGAVGAFAFGHGLGVIQGVLAASTCRTSSCSRRHGSAPPASRSAPTSKSPSRSPSSGSRAPPIT